MPKNILIIDAHPDTDPARFCHAIVSSYRDGAAAGGHAARIIRLADAGIAPLLSRAEQMGDASAEIKKMQQDILWSQHIVIVYPLWLGEMPAKLKAFFEQVLRPDFAFSENPKKPWDGKLRGRSARIIVTMGMPAIFYRMFYRAHSVKALKRNILHFVGIKPVCATYIGSIETQSEAARKNWLLKISGFGKKAI